MSELDAIGRVLAAQGERRRRLDAARNAVGALMPDELQELAPEFIARLNLAIAAMEQHRPVGTMSIETVPPVKILPGPKQKKVTLRQAITSALSDGAALATGDIFSRVQKLVPDAQYVSVASEIKRMRGADPALLTERGENDRGAALYALAKKP